MRELKSRKNGAESAANGIGYLDVPLDPATPSLPPVFSATAQTMRDERAVMERIRLLAVRWDLDTSAAEPFIEGAVAALLWVVDPGLAWKAAKPAARLAIAEIIEEEGIE